MFPAWTMEFKKVVQIESSKGTALIPTLFLMTVRPRELMGRITAGPHTASKAKALFSRPHYPTLTVTPTGTQALVSQSYRLQQTTRLASQKTLVRRISVQPRPKSPFNTSSGQQKKKKKTRAQGSISLESYFRFHIRVTGGLG